VPDAVLEVDRRAVCDRFAPLLDEAIPILRVKGGGPSLSLQLVKRLSRERPPGRRILNHGPIGIGGPNDLRGGFYQRPKPLLVLAQRRLGSFALGDVHENVHRAHDRARRVAQGRWERDEWHARAVRPLGDGLLSVSAE
jgi:hypothetical protein